MSDSFGVCGVGCRGIPVKRDGRLRAHPESDLWHRQVAL